jgi:hypothetical protein
MHVKTLKVEVSVLLHLLVKKSNHENLMLLLRRLHKDKKDGFHFILDLIQILSLNTHKLKNK